MLTSTNQPLPWVQPYAQDLLARTQDVANQGYQASPNTATQANPYLQTGWNAIANRAMQGNPQMGMASQQLGNTIGGGYLGRQAQFNGAGQGMNPYAMQSNPYTGMNNPYLQSTIDNAQQDVVRNWNTVAKPAWDTSMQRSGSFGNSGIQEAQRLAESEMQRNLGRISTDARMGAYGQSAGLMESQIGRQANAGQQAMQNQFSAGQDWAGRHDSIGNIERQLQQQAMGMAPQFAQNDYFDAQQLLAAGNQRQGFDQASADQNYRWWQESQNFPLRGLEQMRSSLGMGGALGSQTSTPDPSKLSTGIGGAMVGSQLSPLFGGTQGQGALWGGLLGLLGG